MSKEFTIIFFNCGVYDIHKVRLKSIINRYKLRWNDKKIMNLKYDEILNIYDVFGYVNEIKNDMFLKERNGSSGVWESENEAVKIIIFEKKNEKENLPVLIVYKGSGESFFKEFVEYCVNIGCSISQVVEDDGKLEVVFKKRINVELINRLNNVNDSKEVMKMFFLKRINKLREFGYEFSDSFVKEWQDLIDKYGCFNDGMLHENMKDLK